MLGSGYLGDHYSAYHSKITGLLLFGTLFYCHCHVFSCSAAYITAKIGGRDQRVEEIPLVIWEFSSNEAQSSGFNSKSSKRTQN